MEPTIQAVRPRRRLQILLVAIILVATVELLLPLLVTLIAPRLLKNVGTSKHSIAQSQVAVIAQQVNLFLLDQGGRSPPDDFALAQLTQGRDAYLRPQDLIDPWGRPYLFEATPTDFTISTLGRDGLVGGEGEGADIAQSITSND